MVDDGTRWRFSDAMLLMMVEIETWVPVETMVGFVVDGRGQVGLEPLGSHGESSASCGHGHDLVLQAVQHLRGKPAVQLQLQRRIEADGIELKVGWCS